MHYENQRIPEGINVSKTHPLVEFATGLAGVAGICITLVGTIYLLGGWLLPQVPFSMEQTILESYQGETVLNAALTPEEQKTQEYLQTLADQLTAGTQMAKDMTVIVRYSQSEQQNAYATLGGNIVINEGLLQALETENGLAMVLGHEIGHIVHRDPLLSLGRGTVAVGALALLSGFSQTNVANTIFSISTQSLLFSFSRDQERRADTYGLKLLKDHYGHRMGADEFFRHALTAEEDSFGNAALVEFFSTHPDLEERIERIDSALDSERNEGVFEVTPPSITAENAALQLPLPTIQKLKPTGSGKH
jgi:Zn-dependent protease with chaperone function